MINNANYNKNNRAKNHKELYNKYKTKYIYLKNKLQKGGTIEPDYLLKNIISIGFEYETDDIVYMVPHRDSLPDQGSYVFTSLEDNRINIENDDLMIPGTSVNRVLYTRDTNTILCSLPDILKNINEDQDPDGLPKDEFRMLGTINSNYYIIDREKIGNVEFLYTIIRDTPGIIGENVIWKGLRLCINSIYDEVTKWDCINDEPIPVTYLCQGKSETSNIYIYKYRFDTEHKKGIMISYFKNLENITGTLQATIGCSSVSKNMKNIYDLLLYLSSNNSKQSDIFINIVTYVKKELDLIYDDPECSILKSKIQTFNLDIPYDETDCKNNHYIDLFNWCYDTLTKLNSVEISLLNKFRNYEGTPNEDLKYIMVLYTYYIYIQTRFVKVNDRDYMKSNLSFMFRHTFLELVQKFYPSITLSDNDVVVIKSIFTKISTYLTKKLIDAFELDIDLQFTWNDNVDRGEEDKNDILIKKIYHTDYFPIRQRILTVLYQTIKRIYDVSDYSNIVVTLLEQKLKELCEKRYQTASKLINRLKLIRNGINTVNHQEIYDNQNYLSTFSLVLFMDTRDINKISYILGHGTDDFFTVQNKLETLKEYRYYVNLHNNFLNDDILKQIGTRKIEGDDIYIEFRNFKDEFSKIDEDWSHLAPLRQFKNAIEGHITKLDEDDYYRYLTSL